MPLQFTEVDQDFINASRRAFNSAGKLEEFDALLQELQQLAEHHAMNSNRLGMGKALMDRDAKTKRIKERMKNALVDGNAVPGGDERVTPESVASRIYDIYSDTAMPPKKRGSGNTGHVRINGAGNGNGVAI